MTLFLFAHSMFGILFVIRTLGHFGRKRLLSTFYLSKVGAAWSSMIASGTFFLRNSPILSFFVLISLLFALQLSLRTLERRVLLRILEDLPRFIDLWILNLRLGLGAVSARKKALCQGDARFVRLIEPFFDSAEGCVRSHTLVPLNVLRELRAVELQNHSVLPRLEGLRQSLKRTNNFRRKSGLALMQTHVQATTLGIIHALLILFTIYHFGWRPHFDLIAISILWSAVGASILLVIARRVNWSA